MQNTDENGGSTFDYNAFMKTQVKQARIRAITLGCSTVLTLIFLIYAFILKAEADKARATAESLRIEMDSLKRNAQEQAEQAKHAIMATQEEALRQRMIAMENEKMLAACLKTKK
jgi:hypothetical protein